jgi:hypothetical protein
MQQEITLNLCTNSNEFKQVSIYFLQKKQFINQLVYMHILNKYSFTLRKCASYMNDLGATLKPIGTI